MIGAEALVNFGGGIYGTCIVHVDLPCTIGQTACTSAFAASHGTRVHVFAKDYIC